MLTHHWAIQTEVNMIGVFSSGFDFLIGELGMPP
jgi:hypothetical protein